MNNYLWVLSLTLLIQMLFDDNTLPGTCHLKSFFVFFLRAAWRLPLETLFGWWTWATLVLFLLWGASSENACIGFIFVQHGLNVVPPLCSSSSVTIFTILFQAAFPQFHNLILFPSLDFARVKGKESEHYHHRDWSLVKYLSKTLTSEKWAENGVEIRRPWKYKVQWA